MLRVRDDVLGGAEIRVGDLVVVRRQGGAQPGDIVVAMVEGEVTVCVFERDRTGPAATELAVLGRVVAVLRQL